MRRIGKDADSVRDVDVVDARSAAPRLVGVRRALAGVAGVRRELQRLDGGILPVAPPPAGERAPRPFRRRLGDVKRVLEELRDGLRRLVRLAAVVVAGEDNRSSGRCELAHPADDEEHAFLAGERADMVGVGVREAERLAGRPVPEQRPRADARAGRAPRLRAGDVGRLGEPERAVLDRVEAVLPVEHGRRLTLAHAVLAVDANHCVLRQAVREVVGLSGADFLKSESVEVKLAD